MSEKEGEKERGANGERRKTPKKTKEGREGGGQRGNKENSRVREHDIEERKETQRERERIYRDSGNSILVLFKP